MTPCPRPDKVRHPTRKEARRHADKLSRHGATGVLAYRCCDHFHVGHMSGRPFRRADKKGVKV